MKHMDIKNSHIKIQVSHKKWQFAANNKYNVTL